MRGRVGAQRAELVDGREEDVGQLRLREQHDEAAAARGGALPRPLAPSLPSFAFSASASSGFGGLFPEGPHEHGGLGDVLLEVFVGRGGEGAPDAVLGVVAVELMIWDFFLKNRK